jgi:Nuclease-related domain
MPSELIPIIIELALIGTLALLFWLIVERVIKRERADRKSPFTKTLQRGPGESCLRKIDELDDKLIEWKTFLLVGFGVLVGLAMGAFVPAYKSPFFVASFGVFSLAGAIFIMVRIRQNIRERLNYRLGFDGERHTAQALMPLLGEGYDLFHDLEFKDATGKTFNIDHVLLGPAGVIVVETKTRSKEAAGKGPDATTVRYDGKQIRYPKGPETDGLGQALANAKHLSRELSAHTGEKVFVRAALSLPGWFVTKTCKEEVNPVVHNPEILRSWVLDLPPAPMDTPQRNRIRGFLAKRDGIAV